MHDVSAPNVVSEADHASLMKLLVTIPGLLADSAGGRRKFQVEASTLGEALSAVRDAHPNLGTHVWEESGKVREHVLVYLNDESITWMNDPESRPLQRGDELFFIQAVSGG